MSSSSRSSLPLTFPLSARLAETAARSSAPEPPATLVSEADGTFAFEARFARIGGAGLPPALDGALDSLWEEVRNSRLFSDQVGARIDATCLRLEWLHTCRRNEPDRRAEFRRLLVALEGDAENLGRRGEALLRDIESARSWLDESP